MWPHDELLGKFSRLQFAKAKFSPKIMLLALAREVLLRSDHFKFFLYFKKARSREKHDRHADFIMDSSIYFKLQYY